VIIYVRVEGVRSFVKKIWEPLTKGKWPLCDKAVMTANAAESQKRMRFPLLKNTS